MRRSLHKIARAETKGLAAHAVPTFPAARKQTCSEGSDSGANRQQTTHAMVTEQSPPTDVRKPRAARVRRLLMVLQVRMRSAFGPRGKERLPCSLPLSFVFVHQRFSFVSTTRGSVHLVPFLSFLSRFFVFVFVLCACFMVRGTACAHTFVRLRLSFVFVFLNTLLFVRPALSFASRPGPPLPWASTQRFHGGERLHPDRLLQKAGGWRVRSKR